MKILKIAHKHIYIILLGLIAIWSHWEWFDFNSLLFAWDWNYMSQTVIQSFFPFGQGTYISYANFGEANIQIYFNAFMILWGMIGSYIMATKITVMIPIALLGVYTPYALALYLTRDKLVSFTSAIFYYFLTPFLYVQLSHLFIAFAFAIAPLVLLTLLRFIDKPSNTNALVFILASSVMIAYELRMFYAICFALLVISLFQYKKFVVNKIVLLKSGLIFILLHTYWILPTLFQDKSAITSVANRGLFGNHLQDLGYALANWNHYWTISGDIQDFNLQMIPVFWWVVISSLIFFFIIAIKNSSYTEKRVIVPFFIISLVGITFTKQADAPFEAFYEWMYYHFPGFNLFREATKLHIITSIGYLGLVAFSLKKVVDLYPHLKLIILVVCCVLFTLPALPLITHDAQYLFKEKFVPTEYAELDKIILADKQFSRSLWVPTYSKFSYYDNLHPRVSVAETLGDEWSPFTSGNLLKSSTYFDFLNEKHFSLLLNSGSVRWVILPVDTSEMEDEPFKYYGRKDDPTIRDQYLANLDSLSYLTKIDIGTKNLVVYENKHYLPYIRPNTSLVRYDSYSNLEEKYEFTSNALRLPFDFVVSNPTPNLYPTTQIRHLYEDISVNNIKEKTLISLASSTLSSYTLYTNQGIQSLSYNRTNMGLNFSTTYSPGIVSNSTLLDETLATSTILNSISSDPNEEYVILQANHAIPLNASTSYLGSIKKPTKVYKISANNSIDNSSFEQGLWQDKVGDCNNHDNNPVLEMALSPISLHGSSSLELSATRHIACTTQNDIEVEMGSYLLSISYLGENTQQAGYYISFDLGTSTSVTERLPVKDNAWQTHERIIEVPQRAKKATIFLYAYASDNETKNTVRYDDIQLRKVEEVDQINPELSESNFEAIPLTKQDNYEFTFSSDKYNLENIITNPDFNNGLWQSKVGDCNNYDKNGLLDMRLGSDTRDNGQLLELEATRHIACTGPGAVPVNSGSIYLLSFDYQSDTKTNAGFYVGWSGTSTSAVSERIPITDNNWNTFTKQIEIPEGATSASLLVYAYEKDGKTPVTVRYDNFSLIELPPIHNRYYLVSDPQTNFVEPSKVEFTLVNPTKKLVHIQGATTPFYLAMSESYHPQWQAQFNNEKIKGFFQSWVPWVKPDVIPDEHHFELNGFLNGWYVDTETYCTQSALCTQNSDGSYNMELVLEFTPQRWFYLGLLISGTTFAGCIIFLVYDGVRRRRMKKARHTIDLKNKV